MNDLKNFWNSRRRLDKIILVVTSVIASFIAIPLIAGLIIGTIEIATGSKESKTTAKPTTTASTPETRTTATVGTTAGSTTTAATTAGTTTTVVTTADNGGSNKATDDNTPHVGPNGSVVVDTQKWRVLGGAKTATALGDQYSRQTPDGVFVLARLRVTNGKSESVTLNSDMAKLEVNGDEYSVDSEGETAVEMMGEKTFFYKDLGPHVSTTGWVIFDVPKSALKRRAEVCLHEIGYGSTKGCIRIH